MKTTAPRAIVRRHLAFSRRIALKAVLLLGLLVSLLGSPATAGAVKVVDVGVGEDPILIAVNPQTNKTYVVNQRDNSLTVIDDRTLLTTTVPVGDLPSAMALDVALNKVYVASSLGDTVTVLDGATNATTTINGLPNLQLQEIVVNPVTDEVYVAPGEPNEIQVIDGATNAPRTLPIANAQTVAINPSTNTVYVGTVNYANKTGSIVVLDGATDAVKATIPAPGMSYSLAVNPATNTLYIHSGARLWVIDGATNTVTQRLWFPKGIGTITVNPVTNKLYVPYGDDSVLVIDGATFAVRPIIVGRDPVAIAINEQFDKIYVANFMGDMVTVIDGATNTKAWIFVGGGPDSIAVNPATNIVYSADQDGFVSVIIP